MTRERESKVTHGVGALGYVEGGPITLFWGGIIDQRMQDDAGV